MTYLSVIIPTRSRASFLKDAIVSIFNQTLSADEFEVLVLDNNSTDQTAEVVKEIISNSNQVRYFYAQEPGLHVGRHLGARESRGEMLVFIDDDVITAPRWLEAIKEAFNDPEVAMVGGKILPQWEGEVPDWINLFKAETEYGWTIGYLSLLDFGNIRKEIPANYIYGCNFAIRKSVLYECGGFHPDSVPQDLIKYRGDGETALSLAVMGKGYKSVYEPKATVYHRVPHERLTIEYFCQRAFNQGISDSYTEIRRKHGLNNLLLEKSRKGLCLVNILKKLPLLFTYRKNKMGAAQHLKKQVIKAYEEGRSYHRRQVEEDPNLLEYVLKERYF